jgi:NADH-quinone oxidoreductase subunit L
MKNLILLIPLLPLIGFLIIGLGRKYLPKGITGAIGSGTVLASFIISLIVFFQKYYSSTAIHYFDFFNVGTLRVPFSFLVDELTTLFLLIITGVGFLIHVYSIGYMHEEKREHFGRYFSYLNLFIFSMLLLVMGSNFVIMFIGWEGVGLCSYLLIGYWFKNIDFTKAAKKAFVMNRIGDLGFLLAVFWIIAKLGTADFAEVFLNVGNLTSGDLIGITLLLFLGATGKSAQIPLYTWLPDAMAGPTPVSALIHAATMVTAGIYMIARSHVLFSAAPLTLGIIAVIGAATALLAATIAIRQNDIQKSISLFYCKPVRLYVFGHWQWRLCGCCFSCYDACIF